jgi:hypothetical protein
MLKRYFWLVYLLLVTLIAETDMVKLISRQAGTARPNGATGTPNCKRRSGLPGDWGAEPLRRQPAPKPRTVKAPEPVAQLSRPQLQLKLVGTVAGVNNQYLPS